MLPGTDYILIGLANVHPGTRKASPWCPWICFHVVVRAQLCHSVTPAFLPSAWELIWQAAGRCRGLLGGQGAAGRWVGGDISPCCKTVPFQGDILAEQSFHPEPSSETPWFLSSRENWGCSAGRSLQEEIAAAFQCLKELQEGWAGTLEQGHGVTGQGGVALNRKKED